MGHFKGENWKDLSDLQSEKGGKELPNPIWPFKIVKVESHKQMHNVKDMENEGLHLNLRAYFWTWAIKNSKVSIFKSILR